MTETVIRDLLPADAPALTSLFERCYGKSYGTPVFYDHAALARLVESGGLRSVVAAGADGVLLGHTGIRIHAPHARICETGNTVVDPDARGQGLLKRLGTALRERVLREGFAGYVHYPTTAHEIMQRASVSGGGSETGLMLAYIAETTEYRAVDRRAGRLAATVAFQPLALLPERQVWMAPPYRELLQMLYAGAGLVRRLHPGDTAPDSRSAVVDAALHGERGVLSLTVAATGPDLGAVLARQLAEHDAAVAHLDISMDEPSIGAAVAEAQAQGFFFSALLPEFGRTDVLRLQRLKDPAAGDFLPDLVNPTARQLCTFMRSEVGAGPAG